MDRLPKPELKPFSKYVASPKQLMAYLKLGCEVKQVGQNHIPGTNDHPLYYLIAPDLQWEVELLPKHVQALEALELIEVDCSVDNYWISKQSFEIPKVRSTTQLNLGS